MQDIKEFVDIREELQKKINLVFKRIFDIGASFFGLVILSPILLLIAILIKIDSKGPVFFKQQRVGKNKKILKSISLEQWLLMQRR